MERYEHKQVVGWIFVIPALVIGINVMNARLSPDPARNETLALSLAASLLIVVAAIFSQLTTRVDDAELRWFMGWGWPSGKMPLDRIASIEITQTSLLEGFGIHWTIWHGWLWNVGGFRALEIRTVGGARVTIGTDDPERLYDAIVARKQIAR